MGKEKKENQTMKNYEKPEIKEINVNLEDIIAVSNQGSTNGGGSSSLSDLFGGN